MRETSRRRPVLFRPVFWSETRRIADILRKETIGGALLLAGAVLAMAWANSAGPCGCGAPAGWQDGGPPGGGGAEGG